MGGWRGLAARLPGIDSMKQLTIDWTALELAFDDHSDEFAEERTHYFDVETGELIFIDEEIISAVDDILAGLGELFQDDADWTDDAIRETSAFQRLPAGEHSAVIAAIKIGNEDTDQFESIPCFDSGISFEWMREFIGTVEDNTLRDRLREAISQGKPFRKYCDALHCGLRPYLHDDFDSVRLEKDLIAQPPVVLWPKGTAMPEVPADVREQLIEQLAGDETR